MINSHEQTEFCLKSYALMIETLSDGAMSLIFQNEMDMVMPLLRYLKEEKLRVSTQIEARKVIEVIAEHTRNLQWIQNLLYQFLQLTTIENADLQTFSNVSSTSLDEMDQK